MCIRKKRTPESVTTTTSGPPYQQQMTLEPQRPPPTKEAVTPRTVVASGTVATTVRNQTPTPLKMPGSRTGSRESTSVHNNGAEPAHNIVVEPARKMNAKRVIDATRNPHDPHYKTLQSCFLKSDKDWDSAELLKAKDLEKSRKALSSTQKESKKVMQSPEGSDYAP